MSEKKRGNVSDDLEMEPDKEADVEAKPETDAEAEEKEKEKQQADAESDAESKGGAEDEELKTKYMRLAADFQNYKRRTEKEKSDIYAYANEKIVTELLDVIDNFERAMLHQGSCADNSMAEGMSMILKQLLGVLEKNNVEEMKAQGEEFDPNFHNAVMTENSVEYKSGQITQVLQKGYLLNGKVIRPAMVKVAE